MSHPNPIAKPPFATDIPDADYQVPPPTYRRKELPDDPNKRTSAYDMYDNYLDHKEKVDPFQDTQPPSIAAPRPGYAAPISTLNLARPEPAALDMGRGASPMYSSSSPTTPHPLQPPMSPITPVFARPSRNGSPNVQFTEGKPIMRGNKEETLLPKRGDQGDDFWRRFSMVAKEDPKKKSSTWLRKTQNGTTRLSRWVWVIGMVLVICVAGGIGIGWYISHNSPDHQQPTALGGSANNRAQTSSAAVATTAANGSSSPHVQPTHTVAKRNPEATSLPDIALAVGAVKKRGGHVTTSRKKLSRAEWI